MQKAMNEIYFSQLRGRRIYDGAGKMAGKVKDVVVRWDGGMPYITGIRHSGDIHRLILME